MYLIGCSHVSGSELEGEGIGHNTPFNTAHSFANFDFPEKTTMQWLNRESSFMEAVDGHYSKPPSWHYDLDAHTDYADQLLVEYSSLVLNQHN